MNLYADIDKKINDIVMEREEIEKEVLSILQNVDGMNDDLQLETKLRDEAGFDIIDKIDACLNIEKRFGIRISDEFLFSDVTDEFTAVDVVDEVQKRLNGK